MKKIYLTFISLWFASSAQGKDIQIEKLINRQAINCEMPNPILNLVNDVTQQTRKGIRVNKDKQTIQLDQNKYLGVQAYQFYKTKHVEQHDFAVNFKAYGVDVIKIALQGIKTSESESGAYYLIFKGSPTDVVYHLRKVMGNDWNIENTLEETPQGNSKLMCVYAG